VIATQIDDLGVFFLHYFQHSADDATVAILPTAASAQGPAIDDVAVEHEFFAAQMFKKTHDFIGFALGRAKVNIRYEDRAKWQFFGFAFHALVIEQGLAVGLTFNQSISAFNIFIFLK